MSTYLSIFFFISQYFFDICLSDGKQKIAFTALPSLSIFGNDLKRYLNILSNYFLSDDSYNEWIDTKKKRKEILYQELGKRRKLNEREGEE